MSVVVKDATSTPTDQIAVAGTFTQALGDASVSVNVGYETADSGTANDSVLNAGATIAVGDITVGGGMREDADGAMQMDVGASLAMGALSLSAQWASTDTTNAYALGAGYPIGEGVALNAQVDFGDVPVSATNDDGQWVQFLIGTTISF